jgi:succinate dehydrogenase / fumarate reductase flavoprotein subunit
MQDLVIVGKARGIIARDLVTGEIERHSAHAVVTSGGYGNVFFLPMRWVLMLQLGKYIKKELFANPTHKFTPCIPVSGDHQSKLTLMSGVFRNDGRIWVPAN